ncbi:RES family NAD+ phosphorylase [Variovorax ginsengisoli]|uniref:RES domain-containing protein n=1 Tax=Variovorax ginsengisoli TaxID=363844 RepID=A0ABT9SAA8_9BURK|nr:RES family NAD+ phosphorylase [Variovorax ginsengisoli]MDP9901289.1 hypothetical protein [Variovorax ginsengisoli]
MSEIKRFMEASSIRDEDNESPFVCSKCFKDPLLKGRSYQLLRSRKCIGCNQEVYSAISVKEIAKALLPALPNHFMVDEDLYPGYSMGLSEIIKHAIGCENENINHQISTHLEKPDAEEDDFYSQHQEYCWKSSPFDSEEHQRWYVVGDWINIAESLAYGQRFFNTRARLFFESLIGEALEAKNSDNLNSPAAIRMLPKGFQIYRARRANTSAEIKAITDSPAVQFNAPPKETLSNNRMNAAGVSLLYTASDPETAISEVRPAVGQHVAVAEFITKKELQLFDFTALTKKLSYEKISLLDPNHEGRAHLRLLLTYLHDEISKPARTTSNDYIVTQALSEFICYMKEPHFDGIIFGSVQNPEGINFVFFDNEKNPMKKISIHRLPEFDVEITPGNVRVYEIAGARYSYKNNAPPDEF